MIKISQEDLLRNEVKNNSPLAIKAKEALVKGEFLEEEIMAKLVIARISHPDVEYNG